MRYEHQRDRAEYFKLGENTCNIHFHRAIELIYCVNGEKQVYIDEEQHILGKDDLLVLPPFTVHRFPENPYPSLCVVMPLEYSDILGETLGSKRFADLIFRDKSVTKELYTLLLKLEHEKSRLARDGIYRYVLGLLTEHGTLTENLGRSKDSFAFTVLNYFEEHYTEKLSLEKVASDLGYNRCYFSTLFKNAFHIGFCEHLAMMRVEKSLPLLKRMPIDDVAEKVGFGSLQSYYSAFKRAKGMPPAAYISKKPT